MSTSNEQSKHAPHPSIRPRTKDHDVTSKDIDGISDLVVWAPIKEGFIDAFNNVTFETRLQLAAEALHSLRKSAREHEHLEPYADTAKRILSLLDFRIGIVDKDLAGKTLDGGESIRRPRKYMYLVATFDGPWEPYIRLIHKPLGPFLDLILSNCEGYPPAIYTPFEDYAEWVRANQLDSAIFYSTSGHTVSDKIYLSDLEKILRTKDKARAYHEIPRLTVENPDDAARHVRKANNKKALSLGLEALNVLYKLTDLYPPTTPDGEFLSQATNDLLRGLKELIAPQSVSPSAVIKGFPESLRLPLEWFLSTPTAQPERTPNPPFSRTEIQKGLLSSYDNNDFTTTHGALVLLSIHDPNKFKKFLDWYPWSWENGNGASAASFDTDIPIYSNIAFTYQGLRRLDVPEEELRKFPKEFRQGMKERAPLIGDKFHNHPRRWRLPARNWPLHNENTAPIDLNEVDVVVQLRSTKFSTSKNFVEEDNNETDRFIDFAAAADKLLPLVTGAEQSSSDGFQSLVDILTNFDGNVRSHIEVLIAGFSALEHIAGFSIIGIESMYSSGGFENKNGKDDNSNSRSSVVDHFGFQDGISQPIVNESEGLPASPKPMDVLLGDLIYGYANTRGDYHVPKMRNSIIFDGSFMVVRKMAQDVREMKEFEKLNGATSSALLVGRSKGGVPLADAHDTDNTFTYDADRHGEKCPFSSHIRLANPRSEFHNRRDPKILRRGMSYGKRFNPDEPDKERGVVFIAYCANIAEQYEVIQRWLNGANSTGVASSQNDPLTGAWPRSKDGPDTFNCLVDNKPMQFKIPKPFVTLEWGGYFFVPSKSAISKIAHQQLPVKDSAQEGRRIIEEIGTWPQSVQQEEWKRIIEDFLTKEPTKKGATPKVWEAIDAMGGVLEIKSGIAFNKGTNKPSQKVILVTDHDLILDIFGQDKKYDPSPFSSNVQLQRMKDGFAQIYVCLDEGEEYYKESKPANDILLSYDLKGAVQAGFDAGQEVLSKAAKIGASSFKMELGRQYVQPAMGLLCRYWYGIPDGKFIKLGPWDFEHLGARKHPVCPGDFLSGSRYAFYPRPTSSIEAYSTKHGRRLLGSGTDYISDVWKKGPDPKHIKGVIAKKLYENIRRQDAADPGNTSYYQSLLLRNIIGSMIGAIPPMEGNLRWILFDWLTDETLWRHQADYHRLKSEYSGTSKDKYDAALDSLVNPLKSAMCVRPAPDLLYRTVTEDNVKIGNVVADRDDLVILCLSAATQKNLREGSNDVSIVFGGNRKTDQDGGENPARALHACPAKDLAIGGMTGILSALLDYGRIKALPASLIVELS